MNKSFGIVVAASIAATAPWLVAPATAAPISSPSALQNAMPLAVEAVQYRRHGYRGQRGGYRGYSGGYRGHRNRMGGAGLGLAAGALIGGAIIGATQPRADGRAYCLQRFRSYDVASGTYLGFDGMRHPCP